MSYYMYANVNAGLVYIFVYIIISLYLICQDLMNIHLNLK